MKDHTLVLKIQGKKTQYRCSIYLEKIQLLF